MKSTEFLSKLLSPNPVKRNITRTSGADKYEESHAFAGGTKEESKLQHSDAYPI
jgi:hypothetical protein